MPFVVPGRVFGYAARVRGSRVSAARDLDLRPTDRYPYRFHIGIPKYAGNGTELFGGDRMCPSMQGGKTCTLTKDGTSGEYTGVMLIESATRGHNGREYTIIRFVLPKELANRLKAYRRKEVEMHLRGDRIIMLF